MGDGHKSVLRWATDLHLKKQFNAVKRCSGCTCSCSCTSTSNKHPGLKKKFNPDEYMMMEMVGPKHTSIHLLLFWMGVQWWLPL